MTSLRPLSAATMLLAVLGAGCSAAGPSMAVNPSVAQALPNARSHGRPIAAAGKNYVYVADDFANVIWIFPAGPANPNPIGSITSGISGPEGLAVDAAGNLYVTNTSNNSVTIYPRGSSTPSLKLSQDLTTPAAVAVDSKGNVWVSNELGSYEGSVVEFPAGSTSPSTVISGLNPLGIAVDSKENLYVANYNDSAAFISVYSPGSIQPSKEFGSQQLLEPTGVMVGPTGDVYVCDFYYGKVFVYRPRTYALRTSILVEQGDLGAMTLAHNKRLYVADDDVAVVSEFSKRGFGRALDDRFHNELSSAYGVAADPPVTPGP